MSNFSPEQLFNCCTNNEAPDWSRFANLEIGGCVTVKNGADSYTIGSVRDSDAEFWTVYGRLLNGECEAIADCWSRADAEAVAAELSRMSCLPID